MDNTIKLCRGQEIVDIPRKEWERNLLKMTRNGDPRTEFMSEDHRRVRYFVAGKLPMIGRPISTETVSRTLNLSLVRVNAILDELAEHLVFVIRNEKGAVSWAFPVTVEKTPHRLTFSTGEQIYGA